MLDESMSAWRPKNLKTGNLPNVSYKPRKPTPLGTMLRNAVECLSGCLAFQDVVVCAERQQMKPHFFSGVETSTKAKSQLWGSIPYHFNLGLPNNCCHNSFCCNSSGTPVLVGRAPALECFVTSSPVMLATATATAAQCLGAVLNPNKVN